MSRAACLVVVALAALCVAALEWVRVAPGVQPQPSPDPDPPQADGSAEERKTPLADPPQTTGPAWVGAQSCATAACHGSPLAAKDDPQTPWREPLRNEYLVWFDRDPHAKALATLSTPESRRMAAIVAKSLDVSAHEIFDSCYPCHAPLNAPARGPSTASAARKLQGVSCEACHGPAGDWLHRHYDDGWRDLSVREKAEQGMIDTASLAGRANVCAGCHVGSPGREVNHDLIVAGHPALKFELTSYIDYLKQHRAVHWDDAAERANVPDFEVRSWLIGRLTSQAAALELTASRVERDSDANTDIALHSPVWPEFSEFDCASCHHELTHPSWRQVTAQPGEIGRPAWQSWYFSPRDFIGLELSASRAAIERFGAPNADQLTAVARQLRQRAAQLDARTDSGPVEPRTIPAIPTPLGDFDGRTFATLGGQGELQVTHWDEACQAYFGLHAVEQAFCDAQTANSTTEEAKHAADRINARLAELRTLLAAPAGFGGVAVTKDNIQSLLNELVQAMRAGKRFD